MFCTIVPFSRRLQRQLGWIGNFIRRHQPRTEAATLGKGIAGKKLAGMALPVADAAFVVAGVTCDMVERAACGNAPTGGANDKRQLSFIVEIIADLGLHKGLQVSDLAAGKSRKERRLLGDGPTGLGHVIAIIQADTDDLAGIGYDGRMGNRVQGVVRLPGREQRRGLIEPISFEQFAQVSPGKTASQVENTFSFHRPVRSTSLNEE